MLTTPKKKQTKKNKKKLEIQQRNSENKILYSVFEFLLLSFFFHFDFDYFVHCFTLICTFDSRYNSIAFHGQQNLWLKTINILEMKIVYYNPHMKDNTIPNVDAYNTQSPICVLWYKHIRTHAIVPCTPYIYIYMFNIGHSWNRERARFYRNPTPKKNICSLKLLKTKGNSECTYNANACMYLMVLYAQIDDGFCTRKRIKKKTSKTKQKWNKIGFAYQWNFHGFRPLPRIRAKRWRGWLYLADDRNAPTKLHNTFFISFIFLLAALMSDNIYTKI